MKDNRSLIKEVNQSIENTFKHTSIDVLKPKDIMNDLIIRGIFKKDHRNGLPLRNLLRTLEKDSQLNLIPSLKIERKPKNIYWYFVK